MFGLRKKRLKKELKLQREQQYAELNKMFRDKHQIICNWYSKKHLKGLDPHTREGFEYQTRLRIFFGMMYNKLPGSYDAFSNVNYGWDDNFDFTPVEKLQELYNQIEKMFPEPFIIINREKKLKRILYES